MDTTKIDKNNISFKYVNFDQDITKLVLEENRNDNTLFLFPTVSSRNQAIKLFQDNWNFSNSDFFTLEDWKYSLFYPKHKLLKEEKRSLAFYLSLDESSKKLFNITDYFSSIEIGNKLFSFWEEINEELVNIEKIDEIIEQKITSRDWQKNTFGQMVIIRENYRHFIATINFSDKIFSYTIDKAQLEINYEAVVVVNQFYLTNLEKHLLRELENVTIYNQFPQQIFDTEKLSICGDFSASMLTNIRTKKITEITTAENFSMICSAFEQIEKDRPSAIIDFRFSKQPYSNFFSREKFVANKAKPFSDSSIYRFFFSLKNILNEIIYLDKLHLLPLHFFLEAIISENFLSYFCTDISQTKEDIANYLFSLAEYDYQYIDLELEFINRKKIPKDALDTLQKISDFIFYLHNIKSMKQFNLFISNFDLEKIITEKEANYSNIKNIFSQIKSDFAILDKQDIVEDWKEIFSRKKFSENVLKLFIDYMKAKTLLEKLNNKKRITITSLQDTRNLLYHKVFVLNVTEGILPPKRKIPFLLSENQRKTLGLKTYDDIRLREKYYFYRLIAQSEEVILFSNENLEENREVSSFAEELKIHFPEIYQIKKNKKFSYGKIYDKYLGNSEIELPKIENIEDFHKFEFSKKDDFPDNNINLSFYKWKNLKENPFSYYLQDLMNIKERTKDINPDFTGRFIGNLTHEIFNVIWERIITLYEGIRIHHNFLHTNKTYVDDAIDHILATQKELIYKIPHNYTSKYFEHIFLPILKKGILEFFYFLHNTLDLSDKQIVILPETDKTASCKLFDVENFAVNLRGKADMRIENEHLKYIFDYKTGSNSPEKKKSFEEQLLMYEQIYYLANKEELSSAVKSYLYFVEKQETHKINYKKKDEETVMAEFKENIRDAVKNMINNGFKLGEKVGKYEPLDITRRDLKLKNNEETNDDV